MRTPRTWSAAPLPPPRRSFYPYERCYRDPASSNMNVSVFHFGIVGRGLYPALLDADAPSRGDHNYMTIGASATLTFVAVRNNFYADGRQILGQNFTFSL